MFSYLQKRGERYYYRIKVPQDLRPAFPSSEIKKSLQTRDLKAARILASAFHSKVQNTFALFRADTLQSEQLETLVAGILPQKRAYKVIEAPLQSSPPLADAIHIYIKERSPRWSQKTRLEFEGVLSILLQIIGNKEIALLTREDALRCRDTLQKLPANFTKRPSTKGLPIQKVITSSSGPSLHAKTVNKYLVQLSSLLRWAVRNGFAETNVAEGLLLPVSKNVQAERKAYNREDIQCIQANLPQSDLEPEKYWVPLIAMHSGMRLDEICQLHLCDIRQEDGIWCFDINDEGTKKVKTEASKRLVPFHPHLLELGLLHYWEGRLEDAGDNAPLWPNLTPNKYGYWGKRLGNWYGRFNRKHITSDPKKCFHSFRHTVADGLKQQGVPEGIIAELLGHANASITTGRYGKRFQIKTLHSVLKALRYEVGADR